MRLFKHHQLYQIENNSTRKCGRKVKAAGLREFKADVDSHTDPAAVDFPLRTLCATVALVIGIAWFLAAGDTGGENRDRRPTTAAVGATGTGIRNTGHQRTRLDEIRRRGEADIPRGPFVRWTGAAGSGGSSGVSSSGSGAGPRELEPLLLGGDVPSDDSSDGEQLRRQPTVRGGSAGNRYSMDIPSLSSSGSTAGIGNSTPAGAGTGAGTGTGAGAGTTRNSNAGTPRSGSSAAGASKNMSQAQWEARMAEMDVSKSDLNSLIMNYLVVEGYQSAARKFAQEADLSADMFDMESIQDRMVIKSLIQAGQIQRAIEKINDVDPELLDTNESLHFALLRLQLTELIRQCRHRDIQPALDFAMAHLAERAPRNPQFRADLEHTMALLCFPEENLVPQLRELMDPKLRAKVATDVNNALLERQGLAGDSKIKNLVRLWAWGESALKEKKVGFPPLDRAALF